MTFSVVDTVPWHIWYVADNLRDAQKQAAEHLGAPVRETLMRMAAASAFVRTWFRDDEPIGVGGVTGTMLSSQGRIWLALTNAAERYPVEMMRTARRELDLLNMKLATDVFNDDLAAIRFAEHLGFRSVKSGEHLTAYEVG